MKKILLLLLVMFSFSNLFGINPIPSYMTPVLGFSAFAEITNNFNSSASKKTLERRELEIQSNNSPGTLAPGKNYAWVYIYPLENPNVGIRKKLYEGGIVSHRIDNRPWGCTVKCESSFVVSVWISTLTAQIKHSNDYIQYDYTDTWGINSLV